VGGRLTVKLKERMKLVESKDDFFDLLEQYIMELDDSEGLDYDRSRMLAEHLYYMQDFLDDMDAYYDANNLKLPEKIDWNFISRLIWGHLRYK